MSKQYLGSSLTRSSQLPRRAEFPKMCLVIYDRILERSVPGFSKWVKQFDLRYPVDAGEKLKDVDHFPSHVKKIANLCSEFSYDSSLILVVGGGSVGDFGAFVASILKRGMKLAHMPSTWLAALDSSHGGKTALNTDKIKNQIGTYYPAERIFLVEKLLKSQPKDRADDALGELFKIALLDKGRWVEKFLASKKTRDALIWSFLIEAISAKYRVVVKDPLERTGLRRILNLGHTYGHILEARYGISHGRAVYIGLYFAVDWSHDLGIMSSSEYERVQALLDRGFSRQVVRQWLGKLQLLDKPTFCGLAARDKKRGSNGTVNFIFLAQRGKPMVKEVSLENFYRQAKSRGWVK
jgi:3-dehydroquinate synthase